MGPASVSTMPLARREGVPGDGDQHLGGCRLPFWPPWRYRRQISTRASARAWAGVRVSAGSRLAGSVRASRACRTIRPLSGSKRPWRRSIPDQSFDRCRARRPCSRSTSASAASPIDRPLPGGQHLGDLLGSGGSHLGHQGCLIPGELVGRQRLRLRQHLHPGLGHLTGRERLLGLGHLLQSGSHRYLAAAHRHRLPRQSGQPLGGRTRSPPCWRRRCVPPRPPRPHTRASARARSRASRCRPSAEAAGDLPAGSSASISHAQSASTAHTTEIPRDYDKKASRVSALPQGGECHPRSA